MIGSAVRAGLTDAGFTVDWVTDGRGATLALADGGHDVDVLDLGLPRQDGMAVLAAARADGNRTPVLIATARDDVADRIAGLDAGADDYVVKPFDLDELAGAVHVARHR